MNESMYVCMYVCSVCEAFTMEVNGLIFKWGKIYVKPNKNISF